MVDIAGTAPGCAFRFLFIPSRSSELTAMGLGGEREILGWGLAGESASSGCGKIHSLALVHLVRSRGAAANQHGNGTLQCLSFSIRSITVKQACRDGSNRKRLQLALQPFPC